MKRKNVPAEAPPAVSVIRTSLSFYTIASRPDNACQSNQSNGQSLLKFRLLCACPVSSDKNWLAAIALFLKALSSHDGRERSSTFVVDNGNSFGEDAKFKNGEDVTLSCAVSYAMRRASSRFAVQLFYLVSTFRGFGWCFS